MPILDTMTVSEVLAGVMKFQGAYIEGPLEDSFNSIITTKIVPMCTKKKEEPKLPSPVPVAASTTRHSIVINNTSLPQNHAGGGGATGTPMQGTPMPGGSRDVSRNPSSKEGVSDAYGHRSSTLSDRIAGEKSVRSVKNENARSVRIGGSHRSVKTPRLSFDGAEGSNLGTTRSPIYSDQRLTPTNSDQLRLTPSNSDQLRISPASSSKNRHSPTSSGKDRWTLESTLGNTILLSLPSDAEQLLAELSSFHGSEGHRSEGSVDLHGNATAMDGTDSALLSSAVAGNRKMSTQSNEAISNRIPAFDDRSTHNDASSLVNNGVADNHATPPVTNMTSTVIPGLMLSKQHSGGATNGPARGQMDGSRNSSLSSRNVNKAILGDITHLFSTSYPSFILSDEALTLR